MLKFLLNSIFFSFVSFSAWVAMAESQKVESSSNQELSLKQDRKELDELRKDIPEEVKRENDDLAFILKLFEDKNRKPAIIRSQFDKTFNRLRKKKQKEFKKERDQFTRSEKATRDKFVSDAKKKRKEFISSGASADAKKEFFATERTERKAFFSDQKEKRNEFESDMKAKRKDFDDFMKDRRKDFDDRYKQFIKEQKEAKALEKAAKQDRRQNSGPTTGQLSAENQKYLNDFDKIPKKEGSRLRPPEEK